MKKKNSRNFNIIVVYKLYELCTTILYACMLVYLLNYFFQKTKIISLYELITIHDMYIIHLCLYTLSHNDLVFWFIREMISMAFISAVLKCNTLSSPTSCKQA